jgi:hypothetical protein
MRESAVVPAQAWTQRLSIAGETLGARLRGHDGLRPLR